MLPDEYCNMTKEKKNKFAFWFVLSLILNGYATGIPGISLGSAVFIIMIILTILNDLSNGKNIKSTWALWFGIVLTVSSFLGSSIMDTLYPHLSISLSAKMIGFAKFWTWILFSSIVVKRYYDQEFLTKWMILFAYIMTVYIIFQSLFYYGPHIYLPNIFRFGPIQPYVEGYADYERLGNAGLLRPAGLLSESSYYGNFVMCTTVLYLEKYTSELSGKRLTFVLFLTFGIVLSGSTSAIIFQGLVLVFYFNRIDNKSKIHIILIVTISAMIIGIVFLDKISESFIGRTLDYSFGKFDYLDRSTRFGKSYNYLELLPKEALIMGVGIGADNAIIKALSGNKNVYLNSLTSLIVQSGFVGCCFFVVYNGCIILKSIQKKSVIAFILVVAYFVKGVASGIYFSTYGILYMFIIIGQLFCEKET